MSRNQSNANRAALREEIILVLSSETAFLLIARGMLTWLLSYLHILWLIVLSVTLLRGETQKLRVLGFRRERLGIQILWGILFAFVCFSVVTLVFSLFFSVTPFSADLLTAGTLLNMLFFNLLIGIGEELFYRGYLTYRLQALLGRDLLAILIQAFLFGGCHLLVYGDLVRFLVTFFFALAAGLCLRYLPRFSMLSLILGHWLYDVACHLFLST